MHIKVDVSMNSQSVEYFFTHCIKSEPMTDDSYALLSH